MAQLFWQSMLLNSILCNSEVLYGLNQSHIETLESIDKMFWTKVFNCPVTSLTEVLFLETNSISIQHIMKNDWTLLFPLIFNQFFSWSQHLWGEKIDCLHNYFIFWLYSNKYWQAKLQVKLSLMAKLALVSLNPATHPHL